ncbi:hypothetical protein CFC21_008933 [Triticum aestivum]|uniref:DUF4220 domain-containing protein n=3 Tax=Triticum TaxID=4564 RepID=A0A9R0R400_TRITD|nr:hypothetical protein CFC21_008933 [Triticum aestivum]VAH22736.1 unnamed protein product [Triticum turgidum subsp. durum]
MVTGNCTAKATDDFSKHIDGQLLRVNALLVASTIMIGVMVGMGAYGQRYRHHPLTSFLFLGANILFLPLLSYVVSTIGNEDPVALYSSDLHIITGWCDPQDHIISVLMWASLVLIAAVNTTAVVAGDDDKKGRNIGPPATVLLIQAIWTSYLTIDFLGKGYYTMQKWSLKVVAPEDVLILLSPFALIVAKLLIKYYAWYSARGSLAFGRNSHLIVGYMEQLKDESPHAELALPPLIVTGEDTTLVQKEPHGYSLKWLFNQADRTRIDNNGLVTIDKVWRLEDDILLRSSMKQLKYLCFSFALFKLLRCRFASHTIAETSIIKAHNLLPRVLLQDGDDERAIEVIADELCFLHDYYYSSLPTSYSRSWLPILSISISLLSMGWSLFYILEITFANVGYTSWGSWTWNDHRQIHCQMYCDSGIWLKYGSTYFDDAPVFLLAALVVLAEVRDIASYICSNWTKVVMICHYVRHASSWQQSPWKKKLLGRLLRCKCRLLKHWEDKMNQCSVFALHPSSTPVALLRRLIPLLYRKKVPRAVKTAILKPLRSPSYRPSNGVASLCTRLHLQAGNNPLSASSDVKGVASTMLVVHIATSILEERSESHQPESAHETVATHLSHYCAYLVAYAPELLPDDNQWCKSLYRAIQKEAKHAIVVACRVGVALNPEGLSQALSAGSEAQHDLLKNGVELGRKLLKNGAELGKKLVELAEGEGEEVAWEVLANFWSEMILYAAPSDNVDAHAEAIARGGELITLIWALLTHLGVVSRPEAAPAMPNAPSDV